MTYVATIILYYIASHLESIFFVRPWNSTSGHPFKLFMFKPTAMREVRQKFYSQRVITNWN